MNVHAECLKLKQALAAASEALAALATALPTAVSPSIGDLLDLVDIHLAAAHRQTENLELALRGYGIDIAEASTGVHAPE